MNSQFPDSFWNYKNFNMVNELNIAGEFIYDGIDALNRMNTIDEIPLLFSFLYHISVGIERIQKIILVLFGLNEQDDWGCKKSPGMTTQKDGPRSNSQSTSIQQRKKSKDRIKRRPSRQKRSSSDEKSEKKGLKRFSSQTIIKKLLQPL